MSHPFIQDPKHKNHHHPQHQLSLSKSYTRLELPILLPERNEGLRLVEIIKGRGVLRHSYHTTADQERAPTHTIRKEEEKTNNIPSTVITLAVMNRTLKRDYSDLKKRRVYSPTVCCLRRSARCQ